LRFQKEMVGSKDEGGVVWEDEREEDRKVTGKEGGGGKRKASGTL